MKHQQLTEIARIQTHCCQLILDICSRQYQIPRFSHGSCFRLAGAFCALNSINVSLPPCSLLFFLPCACLPRETQAPTDLFFFFVLWCSFLFWQPTVLFLSPSSVRETRPGRQRSSSPHRHDLYSKSMRCYALLYPPSYICAYLLCL